MATDEVLNLKHAASVTQEVTWKYIVPVILLGGLIGNSLTIVVLKRGSLGKSSAVVYLFTLSLLDTGALVTGFVTNYLQAAWDMTGQDRTGQDRTGQDRTGQDRTGQDKTRQDKTRQDKTRQDKTRQDKTRQAGRVLPNHSAFACQLLRCVFPFFSNAGFWVLVAFTLDRYIAVCFPLRKTVLCRPRRAIAVCVVLLVVSAAKSLRTFWTYDLLHYWSWETWSTHYKCYTTERYEYFERHIRPYLSMAFVFAIPFLVIICCNVMIIRRLRQGNRLLQRTNADRKLTQTTAMCLSISFAFFLLASPSFAALVAIPYMHSDQAVKSEMVFRFLEVISAMLLYMHHAVNFYLYCLTGRQFRADLRAALCGRCVKAGTGRGGKGQTVPGKPHQGVTKKTGNGGKISVIEDTAASSSTCPQTTVTSISDDKSTAIG
ncbi:hypothetical protein NP493_787g00025 [Ridgeia piscesae]|uniref:G-protein coupled receptors family 1 profile domain-containing protein n=1 Tax=Ridgeia piscesae TaxID=27915 RepID=A0AAD9NN92_RIDPI|nr:hypothetical protein NP493_787g00025 [Ridgeia piscesae]